MPKTTDRLGARPRLDRLAAAPGLAPQADGPPVDREGGRYGAGLISGVAVMSRGEALGHGMWIDVTALRQTVEAINARPAGTKSRFTHPGLSGDGMGKQLGRVSDGSLDGDVARGDLHFTKTAHSTPDGDLAEHVLSLADEDPESFGLSIAFEHDIEAENAFVEEHGGKVIDSVWGYYDLTDFKSPDPLNTENLFHVRLKELRAVDVVDEPAANPAGLFHRGQEIPAEADALCEYAFGLSDARPASAALGIDPDRLRGFASRFLSSRKLSIHAQGDDPMPKSTALNAGDGAGSTPPDDSAPPAGETPPPAGEPSPATNPPAGDGGSASGEGEEDPPAGDDPKAAALSALKADLAKFAALDPVNGPKWLAEGKTFEEAQGLAIADLQAEKAEMQGKLAAALAAAGGEPIDAGHEGEKSPSKPLAGLTEGQSRFASSIRLPGRN